MRPSVRLLRSPHRGCRPLLSLAALLALVAGALPANAPTACAQQTGSAARQYVYPGAEWERVSSPEAVGYDSARLAELTAYLRTLDTTGMMVVVGGRVLFTYGNLDTLTYLASVRKSILSMLYGNYVADGTIDLNKTLEDLGMDDVGGLLPIEKRAKVEHLITARSGVYHPASNAGDNSADAPPRGSQEPGTYLLYNNWDFNAAGAAFEKMTGRDIYDALQTDLAVPIGMQDFDRSAQRKSGNLRASQYPAYHIWLSVRDMARIGYLMLRDGNWAGRQLVPRDWARRIHSVVTPYDRMNPASLQGGIFGYGYMWWVWDGPATPPAYRGAYTGIGAVGQYITVLPALDLVVTHKTAPYRNLQVSRDQYLKALDLVVSARREPVR
jgi:CubicO group peptidase (beta-lactamase class C family)